MIRRHYREVDVLKKILMIFEEITKLRSKVARFGPFKT
jgi:hypothetical protein